MIHNETEYYKAVLHLAEQRKRLDKQHKQLDGMGLTQEQIKRATDPMESFHLQLTGDVVNYEHNKKMKDLAKVVEELAVEGCGIAWSDKYSEYRPFAVISNDEISDGLEWWHDPEGCGNENFEEALVATYDELMRQLGP